MTQRQWQAAFAIGGLVLVAAWCVQLIAIRSGHAGNYYQFRNSADGFVYPIEAVVKWTAVIVAELAFVCLAIARARHVAAACMVAGVMMFALLMALAMFAMHAPPYFGGFVVFQLLGSVWSISAAMVTGAWSIVRHE